MQLRVDRPVVLGVTGGVASGKSTVVGYFVHRGANSVSADDIARQLLSPGTEMTMRVIAHFGANFALSGSPVQVDRAKLAARIFADDRARRELGEIMHPAIHKLTEQQVNAARADNACRLVAVEIPLLYENRLETTVDRVLVAMCPEAEQVRRLIGRHPALTEADALRQIHAQMPINQKAGMADFTIDTDRPEQMVRRDADELYDRLTQS